MKYTKGYKYRLEEDFYIETNIVSYYFNNELMELYTNGRLLIKKGFCWDGASFIIIDTKSLMIASMVHDALYYLLRHNVIPPEFKTEADALFHKLAIENGCWEFRANYMLKGLILGGEAATLSKNKKKIITV